MRRRDILNLIDTVLRRQLVLTVRDRCSVAGFWNELKLHGSSMLHNQRIRCQRIAVFIRKLAVIPILRESDRIGIQRESDLDLVVLHGRQAYRITLAVFRSKHFRFLIDLERRYMVIRIWRRNYRNRFAVCFLHSDRAFVGNGCSRNRNASDRIVVAHCYLEHSDKGDRHSAVLLDFICNCFRLFFRSIDGLFFAADFDSGNLIALVCSNADRSFLSLVDCNAACTLSVQRHRACIRIICIDRDCILCDELDCNHGVRIKGQRFGIGFTVIDALAFSRDSQRFNIAPGFRRDRNGNFFIFIHRERSASHFLTVNLNFAVSFLSNRNGDLLLLHHDCSIDSADLLAGFIRRHHGNPHIVAACLTESDLKMARYIALTHREARRRAEITVKLIPVSIGRVPVLQRRHILQIDSLSVLLYGKTPPHCFPRVIIAVRSYRKLSCSIDGKALLCKVRADSACIVRLCDRNGLLYLTKYLAGFIRRHHGDPHIVAARLTEGDLEMARHIALAHREARRGTEIAVKLIPCSAGGFLIFQLCHILQIDVLSVLLYGKAPPYCFPRVIIAVRRYRKFGCSINGKALLRKVCADSAL